MNTLPCLILNYKIMKKFEMIKMMWKLTSNYMSNMMELDEITKALSIEEIEKFHEAFYNLMDETNKMYENQIKRGL